VTVAPGVEWAHLKPQVVAMLLDHFISEAPLFAAGTAAGIAVPAEDDTLPDNPEDADIIDQIKDLIETRIRPPSPMMAAMWPIAASAKAWCSCKCRAPARAAPPLRPR
jgi:hypothetical protein